MRAMKTLLIDNYDSFTYNLFQLLAEANGEEPEVVRNDAATWLELSERDFDNVVISPGPGRPEDGADFGVCAEAIVKAKTPLLGVCLGHQGLCWAFGGDVVHAPEAVHGRASAVIHDGSPLFDGIPREFQAVRYHSLSVAQPLPEELAPIAWTSDGVLMAVAHRSRLLWGVQFHPESISTEHGRRLLTNFRDLTARHPATASGRRRPAVRRLPSAGQRPAVRQPPTGSEPLTAGAGPAAGCASERESSLAGRGLELKLERIDSLPDPERAFVHLYGDSPDAFWLDSSRLDERSRFSFMGAGGGPLSAVITYDVGAREVSIVRGAATEVRRETIFDYLRREIAATRHLSADVPFGLDCGFVGYLGYEVKADCGGERAHESPLPDAAFLFADRLIAFDHLERRTYLLCLTDPAAAPAGKRWIDATRRRLAALPPVAEPAALAAAGGPPEFRLSRSRERYLADIARCKQHLVDGDSYEVCLTNRIATDANADPLAVYRMLRRVNPAPFSAFLRVGDRAVLSSSPERFLHVGRDRWVEAKPIKGTARRGSTPAEDVRLAERLRTSEKNRAENLMIADLLRNDLGRVCEIGTVHAPHLMQVESYETVHQLVSTVRGLLRAELEPPDCIRACFPPGSMTGAPKKRTMEIVDELEGEARGVYSGALGYLGLSGACDLSVVIRTIVIDAGSATIGAGGAIVLQSNPEEEYREMLLKADPPMRAIAPQVDPETALGREPAGRTAAYWH